MALTHVTNSSPTSSPSILRYCVPSSPFIVTASTVIGGGVYSICKFHLSLYFMNNLSQGLVGSLTAPFLRYDQSDHHLIVPLSSLIAGLSSMATIITLNVIAEGFFKISPPHLKLEHLPPLQLMYKPPTPQIVPLPAKELPPVIVLPPSDKSISELALTKAPFSSGEKDKTVEIPSAKSENTPPNFHKVEEKYTSKNVLDDNALIPYNCGGFLQQVMDPIIKLCKKKKRRKYI